MYNYIIFLHIIYTVAPRVRPGWFPFDLQNEQRIYWPSEQEETHTFNIQDVEELVFACRVEGKPKPEVVWTFNDLDIASGMSSLNFTIMEVSQGRSALTIVVESNEMQFRMQNVIDCTATNAAGSTRGRVTLQGIRELETLQLIICKIFFGDNYSIPQFISVILPVK